jgi:hypothetical protein
VQVGEAALDDLDPLPAAVVAGIDLRIERLEPEGELVEAVRDEHVQALAIHDRRVELELARRARVPRQRRVEPLEELLQHARRQHRRRPSAEVEGMEGQRTHRRGDDLDRAQDAGEPPVQQLRR